MSSPARMPGERRLLRAAGLDTWSPAQAAARNALLGRCGTWHEPGGSGSWQWDWVDEFPGFEAGVDLAIRLGNHRFVLTFEHIDGLMPLLRGVEFAALPQVTRRALLATAFAGPSQALEQAAGRTVTIDAVCDAVRPRAAHRGLGFRVARSGPAWSSRGRLEAVSDDGLAVLAALCRPWGLAHGTVDAATVPVNLRIFLGATFLCAGHLDQVEPGDLLLVERRPGSPSGTTAVRVGVFAGSSPRSAWIGELEQSHMVLQDNAAHAQVCVAERGAPGAEPGEGSIERLQVSLEFWLAELRVSVADLSAFQVGRLVPLGQPVEGAVVHLTVAGQRVGQGRLVVIGEQLGVQVTRFGSHAA